MYFCLPLYIVCKVLHLKLKLFAERAGRNYISSFIFPSLSQPLIGAFIPWRMEVSAVQSKQCGVPGASWEIWQRACIQKAVYDSGHRCSEPSSLR